MFKPMVSIIVINYNGNDITIKCLQGIQKQTFKDFEIIIVDNYSTDNSLTYIKNFVTTEKLNEKTKIIPLLKNSGFSGGNLEGLKYAEGKYIALLNNDTEPDKKWLFELIGAMENNSDIGICASKLIRNNENFIDSAGDGYSTALKGFKLGEGNKEDSYISKEFIFGACAGAALYRKKMLEETGFFDEDFFLIYEDTDLNFRAQIAGWKVLFVPTAVVYHKVRSSIGIMSDTAIYYSLRNSELVRIKNVPPGVFLRCFPEFLINIFAEFLYFVVKHKKLKIYFKAKMDALIIFPEMLKKRKVIMKAKKVNNKYLLDIMTHVWQKDFFETKIRKFLYG
ncbi:MAG: glycosyltransferase family 2 protein [Proteobacteria bacterium]|nr:glycosyltransferase family 2 protein [Pseudomonadota bacterium]